MLAMALWLLEGVVKVTLEKPVRRRPGLEGPGWARLVGAREVPFRVRTEIGAFIIALTVGGVGRCEVVAPGAAVLRAQSECA